MWVRCLINVCKYEQRLVEVILGKGRQVGRLIFLCTLILDVYIYFFFTFEEYFTDIVNVFYCDSEIM